MTTASRTGNGSSRLRPGLRGRPLRRGGRAEPAAPAANLAGGGRLRRTRRAQSCDARRRGGRAPAGLQSGRHEGGVRRHRRLRSGVPHGGRRRGFLLAAARRGIPAGFRAGRIRLALAAAVDPRVPPPADSATARPSACSSANTRRQFSKRGGAKWRGFVYGGGPVRVMADSIIYHGPMGTAGYQAVTNRMLPLRGLDTRFDRWRARLALRAVNFLVPRLRAWERCRTLIFCNVLPATIPAGVPIP